MRMHVKTKYELEDYLKNRSKTRDDAPEREPSGFMKAQAERRQPDKKPVKDQAEEDR